MPKPSFFLVGALKSGTSAMASYLGQHPGIHLPVKDCCFFGSDLEFRANLQRSGDWFRPTPERYLSFFEQALAGTRVGEASAYYLCSASAAEEIRDFCHDASIIVMLRDPVDMIPSLHNHWLFSLNEDIEDLAEALGAEQERRRGRRIPGSAFWPQGLLYQQVATYADQLERFLTAFGRERVHVILYDDFRSEPGETYRRTLEFLGVASDFEPSFEVMNPSREVRSRRLQKLLLDPPEWIQALARPVLAHPRVAQGVRGVARRLNERRAGPRDVASGLRAELRAHFRPEAQRLGDLIRRDLSAWTA